jgi:RNA polymerase sigma-70 factor, ECF subfamily
VWDAEQRGKSMDLDRSTLSASGLLREMILEPFRRPTAIPSSKEFWCLPEMDVNNSDLEEDGKLLQLMIAGEERGFVSLYQKYQSRVYRFSLQIGGTQHLAEEVTQETFLAMIRAPHKYEATRGPLLLYLFGIARNLAWKSMRRDRLFVAAADHEELPAISAPDAVTDLSRQEQAAQVRQAVVCLPHKYREVVVLCSLQELSYEEAATVLRCSIGTVRSRMHRAKQLLLRRLQASGLTQAASRNRSILRCEP